MTFGYYARNGYYGSAQARLKVDRMRNDLRGDKGFPVWGKPAAGVFKDWSKKLPAKS